MSAALASMPAPGFQPGAMPQMMGTPQAYAPMVPQGVVAIEPEVEAQPVGVDIGQLKEWFNSFQDLKQGEMEEAREARRYYHTDQWTANEREELEKRGQQATQINHIAPGINGIIGVVTRLRQDPKAYPRNKAQEAGADIGTAAVREVCDANNWNTLQVEVALDMAISGIGGCERDLEQTDDGSRDPIQRRVDPETYFYDARSVRADFSDARFQGVYKWLDLDAAIELMPDQEEELRNAVDRTGGASDTGLIDWDKLWYDTRLKRVKIVECWYKHRGTWKFAIHTGDTILVEGESPFKDEKGKSQCRYLMESWGIDHEGTRYSFVRIMKSLQDAVNHRHSYLLFMMSARQVIADIDAVPDKRQARRELARKDGWIERNANPNLRFEIVDNSVEIQGQASLLSEAKAELDALGAGASLLGDASGDASGRALQLQQQGAIAKLGPYFMRWKNWKLRVYRAVWNDVQQFWTNERVIRVSGGDDIQFIPVNKLVMTPMGPRIANAIGQLDVDINLDEGPDVITMRQDVMTAVTALINGKLLPPEQALPLVVELSDLPPSEKQKIMSAGQPQPDPQTQQEQMVAKQLTIAGAQAKVRKTNADADSAQADAIHKIAQAKNSGALSDEHAVHTAQAITDIEHKRAQTARVHADTLGTHMDTLGTLAGLLGAGQPQGMPQQPIQPVAPQMPLQQTPQGMQQ